MKKKATIFLLLFFAFYTLNAAIIRVDVNSPATVALQNGSTWALAYSKLQTAIDAASSGDEIWVATGTYQPASGNSFTMKNGVKIYGGFTNLMLLFSQRNWITNVTTLKGNGKSVITASSTITSATILDGFTVRDGIGTTISTVVSGGGIALESASPVLSNLDVKSNSATVGGGIFMNGTSAPAISNTTVSTNTVTKDGGGIYKSGTGSPTLTNVIISNNNSTIGAATFSNGGAGMYITGSGSPVLTKVQFLNNIVNLGAGGGLMLYNTSAAGNVTINNAVFYNNTGGVGGGIYSIYQTTVNVTNAVFANNSSPNNTLLAAYGAGGISNNTAVLTILNCTFYNNTHGTYNNDVRYINSTATNIIKNCVFYRTEETTLTTSLGFNNGTHPTITYSFFPTYNGFTPASATNVVGAHTNPFFASESMTLGAMLGPDELWMTSDDGLHLVSTSGAFNSGNNTGTTTNDITGINPRIQNTTVDMGAYEGVWRLWPVPVKLISFSGLLQNGISQLNWKTGVEDDFNHFELEKSTDGSNFTTVASIAAKGSESSYSYSVVQPEPKAYYRLRIVDNNTSFTFSNILRLTQSALSRSLQLYPNPARNYIGITVFEDATAKIYNAAGQLQKMQHVHKGTNTIDVSSLSSGIHFCVVNSTTTQFVKQ